MPRHVLAPWALSLLWTLPALAQAGAQREFGMEDPIEHPVAIPQTVLHLLERDETVKECLEEQAPGKKGLASWFQAAAVDLNHDERPDLVLQPANFCLAGANIAPFWIFRQERKGYTLLFKTHSLGLRILRTATRGYFDLETGAASAVTFYGARFRFDGKSYRPRKCWEENLDEEESKRKPHYYRCVDAEKP